MSAAARAGVVVVALAAVAWLGYGLRVLHLEAQGGAAAKTTTGTAPSAAAADRARALYRRAARANADPTPRIDEAALLLGRREPRAAGSLLEGVVRSNPGNLRAWAMLASAAQSYDVARATRAARSLLALYGDLRTPPYVPSVVHFDGRAYRSTPTTLVGAVERATLRGASVVITGWAANGARKRSLRLVAALGLGEVVATARPDRVRPDVDRDRGAQLGPTGFTITVPLGAMLAGGMGPTVTVVALDGGLATPLPLFCDVTPRNFGC